MAKKKYPDNVVLERSASGKRYELTKKCSCNEKDCKVREELGDFCGVDFLKFTIRNKPLRKGQTRKVKSITIELE